MLSAGYDRRSDELEDGVLSILSTSYESSKFDWFLFCCAGLEDLVIVVVHFILAGAFVAAALLFNWMSLAGDD